MKGAAECHDQCGVGLPFFCDRLVDIELESAIARGATLGRKVDSPNSVRNVRRDLNLVNLIEIGALAVFYRVENIHQQSPENLG